MNDIPNGTSNSGAGGRMLPARSRSPPRRAHKVAAQKAPCAARQGEGWGRSHSAGQEAAQAAAIAKAAECCGKARRPQGRARAAKPPRSWTC